MKFIHLADTHLGKSESRIKERELDFYDSFRQVIDYAIENKVDFIVHGGDLFDTARPPTRTLIFTVKELMKLKEANIPLFIVAGSHDIGVGDTIISVLEEMNLLTNLSASRYYEVLGDKIIMNGEIYKDVFLCGLAGKRANIDAIYERLEPVKKEKYNIFIFHHAISDISEKFADITTSLLPKGFDYYASGHWHGFFESKYDKGIVVYPGSTEYNDLKEMETDEKKFFCVVDVETNTFEKIPIKTRSIKSITINCNQKDAKEIAVEVTKEIPEQNEDSILIIKLKGRLSCGVKSEVNRNMISEYAKSKGYLYTKIYLSDLENPETPFVSTLKKSVSEVEEEYLTKQKYGKSTINVAKQMINLFGKKLSPNELKARQDAAIEIVRGFLIDNKEH